MQNSQRKIFLPIALALGSALSGVELISGVLTGSIDNPLIRGSVSTIELASQPTRFWLIALSFAVLAVSLAIGAYRVSRQRPAA